LGPSLDYMLDAGVLTSANAKLTFWMTFIHSKCEIVDLSSYFIPTRQWRWNRQCSEMLAFKLQMLVNHPEESIQHSEHGESLKSRRLILVYTV
jgi:hypothetical protein